MTGAEQTILDYRVSWMLFKMNSKTLFNIGLTGILFYGATRLLISFLEHVIVTAAEFRLLPVARLDEVALLFVDIFMIAFFFSPQHVLAHQVMGTGDVLSDLKEVILKFKKLGVGLAFIILLAGTSLFALQINEFTVTGSESWYLPTLIIMYIVQFVLMIVFTGVFPIYVDTGKFVESVKLQLKMFKTFRNRFIRTWGLYFMIFVVPNAIISIIVTSLMQLEFVSLNYPPIYSLYLASFTLFCINIIFGIPLMSFIAARIYHGLKNCIVNGQVTAVGDGEGGSEASATSGEHKGE
jgi:hypothetical protein